MSHLKISSTDLFDEIILARPEKRNALNKPMVEGLQRYFSATPDQLKRAVVLRAEGPVFCSGLDLTSRDGSRSLLDGFEKMVCSMSSFPLPVVACLQGDAIAGGNELAFHADIVIAADVVGFSMPLAMAGLAPSLVLVERLMKQLPAAMVKRMLLAGHRVTAQELHRVGAIAVVAPDVETELSAALKRLVDAGPLSLRAIKRSIEHVLDGAAPAERADVVATIERVRTSADARAGVAARLERRAPRFSGA